MATRDALVPAQGNDRVQVGSRRGRRHRGIHQGDRHGVAIAHEQPGQGEGFGVGELEGEGGLLTIGQARAPAAAPVRDVCQTVARPQLGGAGGEGQHQRQEDEGTAPVQRREDQEDAQERPPEPAFHPAPLPAQFSSTGTGTSATNARSTPTTPSPWRRMRAPGMSRWASTASVRSRTSSGST